MFIIRNKKIANEGDKMREYVLSYFSGAVILYEDILSITTEEKMKKDLDYIISLDDRKTAVTRYFINCTSDLQFVTNTISQYKQFKIFNCESVGNLLEVFMKMESNIIIDDPPSNYKKHVMIIIDNTVSFEEYRAIKEHVNFILIEHDEDIAIYCVYPNDFKETFPSLIINTCKSFNCSTKCHLINIKNSEDIIKNADEIEEVLFCK